ncbi:MAG: RidA family protein [Longimicrobiaceae bacterium]
MKEIEPVQTPEAPAAIGPYSQAVRWGELVFTAGQIPLDPASGELAGGDDVAAQTERVLRNLAAVLTAAGASLGSVLKTTVFLREMDDFAAVNEVYASHFAGHHPARSTVQAARLPKDVKVEIDAVAVVK